MYIERFCLWVSAAVTGPEKGDEYSLLADGQDKKINMSTNEFLTVICWKESNGPHKMYTGLAIVPRTHCLLSLHAEWPLANTQDCPLCPAQSEFQHRTARGKHFLLSSPRGLTQMGVAQRKIKLSLKAYVIRLSDSTFERFMHPKKNRAFWSIWGHL